jgi:hypothetical protein
MVYDSQRGVTVLFGGNDGEVDLGDTWEWDGSNWILITDSGPAPRRLHDMAYDRTRGVTVLFGGTNYQQGLFGDTWEWDGTAWVQVADSGPCQRGNHAMVYDSARGVAVLFGGGPSFTQELGDTWEWDGTDWRLRLDSGSSARVYHRLAYDSARGVTVLFGGTSDGMRYGDTWEWDGTTWTQVHVAGPAPRSQHDMAFDSRRRVTVLFGGSLLDDTWEYGRQGAPFNDFFIDAVRIRFAYFPYQDGVEIEGAFTLGANSDGINPVNEDVAVDLNNASLTIPAGSFEEDDGEFVFKGVIKGAAVEMEIEAVGEIDYEFELEVAGATFRAIQNPVTVGLTIGDDTGTGKVRLEGELVY